jgi:hypothetical protein
MISWGSGDGGNARGFTGCGWDDFTDAFLEGIDVDVEDIGDC